MKEEKNEFGEGRAGDKKGGMKRERQSGKKKEKPQKCGGI